jgi:hypothetical protein
MSPCEPAGRPVQRRSPTQQSPRVGLVAMAGALFGPRVT